MSLSDELAKFTATNSAPQAQVSGLPSGWTPSVNYDGSGRAEVVTLGTGQPGEESTWADEVRAFGVDVPPGWSVRLVAVTTDPGAWVRHAQGEDAVTEAVTRRKYVVEPTRKLADIDELIAAIGKKRPATPAPVEDGWAYVHAVADWQIGKIAYGEGSEQSVGRILDALDQSVARIKRERKRRPVSTIVIAGLGDLCEGVTAAKGAIALQSDLGLTEQLRVVRRLLLEHVKQLAPLAERIILASAPGNHDEPHRLIGAKPRADDSFAVDAAIQVGDALALAGGYEHVEIVTPDIDDLTITVQAAGTIIGLAHGHQMRVGKAHEWWAKMGHGGHRIGAAHILLTGHYHHLRMHEEAGRLHLQAPSTDNGSPHFSHANGGGAGHGGVVTFYTREGKWTGLELL
jgi:predicted phosphodiesterase